MVCIRQATMYDVPVMQACNQRCMHDYCIEMEYYVFDILSWPQLIYVAEDYRGKIVGCVLAKIIEPESEPCHGCIIALSVLGAYRKLGLATKLMIAVHNAMESVFGAAYVSLHVRRDNRAAICLYTSTALGYKLHGVTANCYQDGEDAFDMRKMLKGR